MAHDPKNDLRTFVTGLQGLLASDPGYETIAPPGVALKILASMSEFLDGKHASLDQALGFRRSKGRPAAADSTEIPERMILAWRMAVAGESWDEIARTIDHKGDPNDLRKKVERHQIAISRMEAERLFRDLLMDDGHKMGGI